MKRVEELIPEIETLKGTLNSVEGILNDLENPKLKEINAILYKASMYSDFLNALNAADPWAGKAGARLSEVNQKVSLAYSFEAPEIMQMPLEKRQEIFSDERLAPYAYCFRKYTDPDFVVLGEEASKVAVLMGTGQNSEDIYNIFDNIELPLPSFTYPDGTEGVLTDEVFSQIMESTEYDHEFRKKIYWTDMEINLFVVTLLRQCMHSEFEDYCYKTIEGGGALDASEMAQKWIELEKLYYGDSVAIYEDSGIDWARISHLYYDYYVYQYATSITYAASVCEQVEQKGQEEVDAYLKFLKAGNSASPAELLGIAGVDPLKDDTYEAAGSLITALIDDFIATVKK